MEHLHHDQENGSSELPVMHRVGGLEISIKVPEYTSKPGQAPNSNGQSHNASGQQHPTINIKTTMGKGIQRSFSTVSNLGNFLPTGTNLAFEAFLPTIYRGGQCSPLSTIMMGVVLGLCAFFCFISSFTDSLELSDGKGTIYGFVTSKGLWVYNHKDIIQDARYKREFADILHAVTSVMVFLAIALSDHRVIDCLFPRYVKDVEQVMESLVLIVAFVCSSLFILFPVYRRGFVPSLPKNVSSIR